MALKKMSNRAGLAGHRSPSLGASIPVSYKECPKKAELVEKLLLKVKAAERRAQRKKPGE